MTGSSPSWTAPEVERVDEPVVGDERAMLTGFLDSARASMLRRCAGLTGEQLVRRSVPPSNLSLLGLVRHVTDVERTWFRCRFAGEELPGVYAREDCRDASFEEVDPAHAGADFQRLLDEQEAARRAVAGASLDDTFESDRWGTMSLRWIFIHMCREYERHCGHADLLRERIDGVTHS
jgi:hypothetical protein